MRVSDFNNKGREERGEGRVKRWKIVGWDENDTKITSHHRGTWQEAYDYGRYDLELTQVQIS